MPAPPFQTLPVSAFNPAYSKALAGDSYMYDSGLYPCPDATEITCCFIQNDDPTRNMVIWAFISSHNGGDTTQARPKVFRGRVGMTLPTSNNTAVTLQPTDGNNTTPAPATAFVTADATGLDGGGVTGFVAVTQVVSAAKSPFDVGQAIGGVIVPPGGNGGCSCFMDGEVSTACAEQFYVSWVEPGQL